MMRCGGVMRCVGVMRCGGVMRGCSEMLKSMME